MDVVGGFGQWADELHGDVGDAGEPDVLAHRPHPPAGGIGTARLAGERAVEVLAVGVAHDQASGLAVEPLAIEGHRQACRVETTDQRGGPGARIVARGVQEQMAAGGGERLVQASLGELDARRTAHLGLPTRRDAGGVRESVDVRARDGAAGAAAPGGSGDGNGEQRDDDPHDGGVREREEERRVGGPPPTAHTGDRPLVDGLARQDDPHRVVVGITCRDA